MRSSTPPEEAYAVSFHSAGNIFCQEVVYPVADSMGLHSHGKAHMVFVLDGTVRSAWRRETAFNAAGSLFFLPPGEPHANDFVPGFRSLDVWFDPSWLPGMLSPSPRLAEPIDCQGGPPIEAFYRLVREIGQADDLTPLVMQSLTVEVLTSLVRQEWPEEARAPAWLRRAREILHASLNRPPTLDALASTVGVHPAYLAKIFKSRYGCTVGEFVRRLRVERAKGLLRSEEKSFGELAAELGFADQSHFCRTFKRMTGQTPTEFRKGN